MSDLKNLKEGDSVMYKNVGYGCVSYEKGDDEVIEIKDGKLFTNCFDRIGMDWDDRTKSWKFDGGLGLVSYAIAADDAEGLKQLAEEEAEG